MPRKIIDLTGQRFGRWMVIRRGANCPHGNPRYECVCDCGGTGLVLGSDLKRGGSRSCGCLRWGWGKCGMWPPPSDEVVQEK
jgi:hypothetical protein